MRWLLFSFLILLWTVVLSTVFLIDCVAITFIISHFQASSLNETISKHLKHSAKTATSRHCFRCFSWGGGQWWLDSLSALAFLCPSTDSLNCGARQFFLNKWAAKLGSKSSCFHLKTNHETPSFWEWAFHGRIDVGRQSKADSAKVSALLHPAFKCSEAWIHSCIPSLGKPSLCRKRSKMDPPQENDIPCKQSHIKKEPHISFGNRFWI